MKLFFSSRAIAQYSYLLYSVPLGTFIYKFFSLTQHSSYERLVLRLTV